MTSFKSYRLSSFVFIPFSNICLSRYLTLTQKKTRAVIYKTENVCEGKFISDGIRSVSQGTRSGFFSCLVDCLSRLAWCNQ
jgi:hypothetical protein